MRSSKRDKEKLVMHFLEILDSDDFSAIEVAVAFQDAYFMYAHESGHQCQRQRATEEDGRKAPKARGKKKRISTAKFFREMGIEPPTEPPTGG